MNLRRKQTGYLLITVVTTLFLLATVAVLLSRDSAISANTSTSELEDARAGYVAQAALQHALWQTANSACADPGDLPDTPLGADSYSAEISGAVSTTSYSLTADQDAWIRNDDVTKNNGDNAEQHIRFESGNTEHALTRFDLSSLPENAQIHTAIAWFHVSTGGASGGVHPEGAITVHGVTADWTETDATWETMGDKFQSSVLATIPAQEQSGVWVSFNLTGQVQAWVNGQPNYGILMASTAEGVHGKYSSREDSTNPPRLEVVVGDSASSSVTIKASSKLDTGVQRKLKDKVTVAYQPPGTTILQLDGSPGAGEDTYLNDGPQSGTNYADNGFIYASGANSQDHGLLRFNLSSVPAGVSVRSATLELQLASIGSGNSGTAFLHRVTSSWVGAEATWEQRESGTNWDSQGGDYDAAPVASAPIDDATPGPVSWDVTELVAEWLAVTHDNNGLLITADAGINRAQFHSGDSTDPTKYPTLSITYACECGSACMAPQGSGNILMVVNEKTWLTDNEEVLRDHLEAWGYTITLISDHDNQNTFDGGAAANDVVFIAESVDSTRLSNKLDAATIGIVNMDGWMNDELGFESGNSSNWPVGNSIDITETGHYITAPFASGSLDIYDAAMGGLALDTTPAAGLATLASWDSRGTLAVLDSGATTAGGTAALNRRVMLPFGRDSSMDWSLVNANGLLVVQRAIDWAMGADAGSAGNVLLVVVDPASLTAQEQAKKALIESFGFAVNLIGENDSQANFDTAIGANDVAYIAHEIDSTILGSKLLDAAIGVVNEDGLQAFVLRFADDLTFKTRHEIDVVDNTHYITEPFATGLLSFVSSEQTVYMLNTGVAPGLQTLGMSFNVGSQWDSSLGTLDVGDDLSGGGQAAGRRVQLPWGYNTFDINQLNDNGRTIMRRAIEWAAAAGSQTGPLAHWKLDETSGVTAVDSVGGNDGFLNGNASWSTGAIDGGLAFDYANGEDYVEIPNSPGLENVQEGDYTLAAWFRPDSTPPGTGGDNDANYGILIKAGWHNGLYYTNDNRFALDQVFDDNSSIGLLSGNTFNPGSFHHVAGVVDRSSGTMSLYVNGQLEDTQSFTPGTAAREYGTEPWRIGIAYAGAASWGWPADGVIDDARIYDRALSAAEVAELAPAAQTLPIAHWKLDDGTGLTAVDAAGGHDGTLENGPAWTAGAVNGGVRFSDETHAISAQHSGSLTITGDLTLLAWIYLDELKLNRPIIQKGTSNVDHNYYLGLSNDNIQFAVSPPEGGWHVKVSGPTGISPGSWHHLAVSFDDSANSVVFYLDGTPLSKAELTHSPSEFAGPVRIGRNSLNYGFKGIIDDARIYARVLDAAEIATLAAEGSGGGGGGGPAEYLDNFGVVAYSGSDGVNDWSASPWEELSESDGPTAGKLFVGADPIVAESGSQRLVIDSRSTNVKRAVDLSGFSSAYLSFTYRRDGYPTPNDYFSVLVSENGSTWLELDRIYGIANDPVYRAAVYDISAYANANTEIQIATGGINNMQTLYVDNVRVASTPPAGCAGVFAEEFNVRSYANNDGTLNWAGDWTEIKESNGPTQGDIQIRNEINNYQLRVRDDGYGLWREVDLSGAAQATLSLDYKRLKLDSSSDYVTIDVSSDGGSTWTELDRFEGGGDDNLYQYRYYDITGHAAANTRIRFLGSPTLGGQDEVWFDDIEVVCTP